MPKNRLVRWSLIIVSVYLIVTTSKGIIDLWHSGDKLTTREKALTALKRDQEDLLHRKAKIESPAYLERIARDKLSLSKPGEEVIIIPKELLTETSPVATPDSTPNWKKWWKLIF